MSTTINNKCPACGAYLEKESGDSKYWKCPYCGLRQKLDTTAVDEAVENLKETVKDAVSAVASIFVDEDKEKKQEKIKQETPDEDDSRVRDKYVAMFLCLFLGYLGIHKFYENKTFWGIVYFFTGGLFSIGIIIDFIKLCFKPRKYYVED